MAWREVVTAKNENRREIVLSGGEVSERITKGGFDESLFELTNLNYLSIHDTCLTLVPDGISHLQNLQTLTLHANKLGEINAQVTTLEKLKVLDLSRNCLHQVPDLSALTALTTLNLSLNSIEDLPSLVHNTKLAVLDVSNNKLKVLNTICHKELANLADVKLNGNAITEIPPEISVLPSLKNLDVSCNLIKVIPGELAECAKLKELNLKNNPVSDRRLAKLIEQCRTKQVIDYVKQHCPCTTNLVIGNGKKNKKAAVHRKTSEEVVDEVDHRHKLHVKHYDDCLKIVVEDRVKAVRPHILGCLVHDVEFTAETFKKFIQLQTKLHDGVCEKRNAATIATHDAKKFANAILTYTALPPDLLVIQPLGRNVTVSGADLFKQLQTEADNLRREKKRNIYSGIHKYLYLLEGKSLYACLMTGERVVSFPPITNSDITKISLETVSIFLEVTSAISQATCRKVLDLLLQEMVSLFTGDVHVQQVRNTDVDGNLKAVYPSRSDLVFEGGASFQVIRE